MSFRRQVMSSMKSFFENLEGLFSSFYRKVGTVDEIFIKAALLLRNVFIRM